ncbi:MAG: fibronectin type III domain-containing protein [Gammaproteobacteria bacterium]
MKKLIVSNTQWLAFLVFVMSSGLSHSWAATITAASCSPANVQTAVNAASDGDTIMIPDGTCSWTTGISTTKQIWIRAQNYTPTPGGNTTRSVIITNNANVPLFRFTTGNSFHTRLSGIRINDNGTGTNNHLEVNGSGSKVMLVDDMFFEAKQRNGNSGDVDVIDWEALGGVIWNTRLVGIGTGGTPGVGTIEGAFVIKNTPRPWNSASTMGSADTNGNINLYVEDSSCLNAAPFPDLDDNGRAVFRHNNIDGCIGVTHGFTSSWGGRHIEWYDNVFSATTSGRNHTGRYYWIRAATAVFTDNVVNNASYPSEYGNPALINIGDNTSPGTYPQYRQPGWGHNGTTNVSDPIYSWSNTGPQAYSYSFTNGWGSIVQLNRDLFVNNGAKPGYSKYPYPHPFRTGGGGGGGTTPPPADTTAPSAPGTPAATNITSSSVALNWTASTDNIGVTGYRVERCQGSSCTNFTQIGAPAGTTYNDTGLTASTDYRYRVRAADAAGNLSGYSGIASATMASGTTGSGGGGSNPLPEGNAGISASYPGDANIGSDANVIFADDFESYTSVSQLTNNWNSYYQGSNTRIATETGNFFAGSKAVEFTLPQTASEVANALVKNVSPTQDTLFVRAYTKFDSGFDVTAPGHNGIRISAQYPGPGQAPNGTDFFLFSLENSIYYNEAEPGYTNIYTYHPEQRSQWGDHWYPDGKVLPFDSTPGNFGSSFVSRPNFIPVRNQWYSYELMVKANTPGVRDGRVAVWIDGNLVADFQNVRARDVSTLKIDQMQLELHAQGSSARANKKWYDNVVVARSYIGPMLSGAPQTLEAPSNLRVVP